MRSFLDEIQTAIEKLFLGNEIRGLDGVFSVQCVTVCQSPDGVEISLWDRNPDWKAGNPPEGVRAAHFMGSDPLPMIVESEESTAGKGLPSLPGDTK